jgi:hypothetical protein
MIRAIETRYHGYRFRSRTEARWGVFFDALGLRWEYEPEGFELPSGPYLPDFRLHAPGWGQLGDELWVEIKPAVAGWAEKFPEEFRRAWEFAASDPLNVWVIAGSPWPGCHEVFPLCPCYQEPVPERYAGLVWNCFAECRYCDQVCLLADDTLPNGRDGISGWQPLGKCCDCEKWPVADSLLWAYQRARGARFEHGEMP